MKWIYVTREWFACVDDDDYSKVAKYLWVRNACGYASGSSPENLKKLLHVWLLGEIPVGFEIDHVNRAPWDNRRDNLRLCSHSENMGNRGMPLNPPYPTEKEKQEAREVRTSIKNFGRVISNKNIKGRHAAPRKQVKNLNTGEIFNSITEAANHYHIDGGGIIRVCRGESGTCCGFKWEYTGKIFGKSKKRA